MGCIYSAVDRNDALRPPKAWKMDFSEYNRPLNENDLDEMRTVDSTALISSLRSTGTIESPTAWKFGTFFTNAATPACRVRTQIGFHIRGLPKGQHPLPRREAAGGES